MLNRETWHKSSFSNGANASCVEAILVDDPSWAKSSVSSGNGNCVEWRKSSRSTEQDCLEHCTCETGVVQIRNSNHRDAGTTVFSQDAWGDFIQGVKDDEFAL